MSSLERDRACHGRLSLRRHTASAFIARLSLLSPYFSPLLLRGFSASRYTPLDADDAIFDADISGYGHATASLSRFHGFRYFRDAELDAGCAQLDGAIIFAFFSISIGRH